MPEKKAYTPAEFAACFGREKTWAYRMLYAGKVNGISDYGRMMIPASEADRIAGEGARYLGRKKVAKTVAKKEAKPAPTSASKGSARWVDWMERRKNNAARTKGMGAQAKRVKRDAE
jgi:hypothetical protein